MDYLRNRKLQLIIVLLLTLLVTFIGHQKRIVGYWVVPDSGILDELSYPWQGLSIRQSGVPIGWSDSGVYHGGDINKRGVVGGIKEFYIQVDDKPVNLSNIAQAEKPYYAILDFDISKQTGSRYSAGLRQIDLVAPFFDHPPLGGLILSLGVTSDSKTFSEVTTFQTRKISVVLAVVTSFLLFALTYLLTRNHFVGILAVAIYNFAPAYFFGSRFALLENILAPAALLHLIILYLAFQSSKKRLILLGLAGFTGGILCLIKESGVGFVIGSLILMKLQKLTKNDYKLFLGLFVLPILFYVLWGMYLSAEVFWKVLVFNSSRQFWGSLNFLTMLPSLRFKDFPFDGWWIFGFVSLFYLSIKKTSIPIYWAIPVIIHLLVVLFLGGQNYSWYYLALSPFLALATSLFLYELFIFPSLPTLIAFFLLALSSSLYWGRAISQFTPSILEYRILFGSTFLFGVLANISTNKKLILAWRIFFIILLIVALFLNYKSLTYLMTNWGNVDYPSLPPT